MPPELRLAKVDETAALVDIFFGAMDDLATRNRRPPPPRNSGPLEQHLAHLIATDPASAVVADDDGNIIAFGLLHVRGTHGFLSFLFVAPGRQGRGIGRAVLGECLRGAGQPSRMATCAEADQPISTGLYASLGMLPRVPVYVLRGRLEPAALPDMPPGLHSRPMAEGAPDQLDERLLGYTRPRDHAFWMAGERHGWLFEDAAGTIVGYGYAHASGRLGPVAAADPAGLPAILGHLLRSVRVADGWQVVVPGPAGPALRALLEWGLRIDGVPAVYCADHSGPAFDRYLPMSFALL